MLTFPPIGDPKGFEMDLSSNLPDVFLSILCVGSVCPIMRWPHLFADSFPASGKDPANHAEPFLFYGGIEREHGRMTEPGIPGVPAGLARSRTMYFQI